MKMLKVILAASMVMLAPACATITPVLDTVVGSGPNVGARTAVDDKLMYAAEAAYNVPAQAYVSALQTPAMTAERKAFLKPKLQYLKSLLVKARQAYAIANTSGLQNILDEMTKQRDEVMPLIPKSGT